jgi:hypothetical protein
MAELMVLQDEAGRQQYIQRGRLQRGDERQHTGEMRDGSTQHHYVTMY